jgi:uncharacterized protein (DUF4415 family)
MTTARRGPVVAPDQARTRITIRLDTEVLNWFRDQVDKAGGGSYQRLINTALQEYIRRREEPLKEALWQKLR